jgi:hypothetical protein
MRRVFKALMLGISLSAVCVQADEVVAYRILLAPRMLKLESKVGTDRTVCFAVLQNSRNGKFATAVAEPGLSKSCSNDPAEYAVDTREADKRGMDTFSAKFIGSDSERAIIGTTNYFMELNPAALIFRTTDAKGKEVYDAVCVTVNRSVANNSNRVSIAYPRTNASDPIQDFKSKVECDGIDYAVRNEIKTVKPDFIGTPEQMSARTAHSQVIQSSVGFGVPVPSTHK